MIFYMSSYNRSWFLNQQLSHVDASSYSQTDLWISQTNGELRVMEISEGRRSNKNWRITIVFCSELPSVIKTIEKTKITRKDLSVVDKFHWRLTNKQQNNNKASCLISLVSFGCLVHRWSSEMLPSTFMCYQHNLLQGHLLINKVLSLTASQANK